MKTLQIKLKCEGNFLTPFQADTIFGHLCWAVAHKEGEKGIEGFLNPFKQGNPPFIISDGFPEGLLPKPIAGDYFFGNPEERKEWKKIEFLSFNDFNLIRNGEKCSFKGQDSLIKTSSVAHNTVNRLTNTTLEEGGVYTLKEMNFSSIAIYVKSISEEWNNRIVDLFKELSKSGFGRKKSIGKGQFSVAEVRDFEFPSIAGPNGFVTLSNFCPAEDDPTEGFYKTIIKYGKLSEEYTFCGNPFKKPLLMIRTGSVFQTNGGPKEFYGRMITEGISPAKPEVLHYAYAFAVPIKFSALA